MEKLKKETDRLELIRKNINKMEELKKEAKKLELERRELEEETEGLGANFYLEGVKWGDCIVCNLKHYEVHPYFRGKGAHLEYARGLLNRLWQYFEGIGK